MASKQNPRKRAPFADITNIVPQSRRNTDRQYPGVNEWYNLCYNNMLSAQSGSHASVCIKPATQQSRRCGEDGSTSFQISSVTTEAMEDRQSSGVNEWYNLCYNNMLSAQSASHASVQSATVCSPPATQQSRRCGEDGSTSNFIDASTPFQISSVTTEAMEGIAADFTRRRDRERYSELSAAQKDGRLRRMREYSSRKRRGAGVSANVEASTSSTTLQDPYDSVYQDLPEGHLLLKPAPDCLRCGAKRFQYESKGFCCRAGKIKVVNPNVPSELHRLFTSQDEDAKYFREHIRYFNSHFSFTSLGVTLDQRYCNSRSGVYTFRAQGQVYHRLDSLVPGDQGPRHLQLYFYDTDADLSHRVERSPDLDINLIRKMLHILAGNPYVQTFRSIGSVPNLDDYRISLNTSITLDQRRYNAPTASQVAAIWVEGNDPL